jgi:SWI/SNF-related matrix-associated actin-dependent regulator of chromatin subfamily A member 5
MLEYQHCTGPHLVVVPKSVLSNWMLEFSRWAPAVKVVKFHGNKEEREQISRDLMEPAQRDEDRTWTVCITTYEVCNLDKNVLNKFAWQYLIIDEAHRLKNEASAFSQTIRTFETRYRLLLTGTPLQNNLHELWALLNFLVPDVFANAEQFDEWFNLDIEDAEEKNKLISQLHKILRPFMLRRLKADVEKSLLPKHETILFTGMSVMQKKLYRDILLRDFEVLQGGATGTGNRTALLNIVMQLRKCAGHPYLFPGVEDRTLPPLGEHLVVNCGKMVLLDKLLRRLKERGHRVLLFTQMTRILDIMEDYLVMRQFKYCRIDGNTSYEDRERQINAYNEPDSEKFLFLLSTRAGGLGINLQTADVVILYDSDWNPQADLQAQDRAHRIGQKKAVQVFRLVTEHTIEEKIVERAQQKLKLDAMVVQQGRLKDKDKLSRDEILAAVRFGADKIFKSKDSSITDDDIDLILDAGRRKTEELNSKLQNAEKGDMLDFKLDGGGMSAQTFEGVDYAKAAHAQAELLGIMDIGKRERKPVANYNENQLYQSQVTAMQGMKKKMVKRKETKLPKYLRLPRLEEWQMFDRAALQLIQDEEEAAFKSLPEEEQRMAAMQVTKRELTEGEEHTSEEEAAANFVLPPLLSEEKQEEKKKLLSEGFADWGRMHYSAFIRSNAKYGRADLEKIALSVGKPLNAVEAYSKAFWSETLGKVRFSEHEYEKVTKVIEKGEKKIGEIKGLVRGTKLLISIFDNPWRELEFSFVNCKDKMFTLEEDRHLLCWSHKFGYGQWEAVKMAIRRNPNFRFDYFMRSLPTELIGRRCEQLMKAAEKEVEQLEKRAREEAGIVVEEEKKGENDGDGAIELPPVELPNFKIMRTQMHRKAQIDAEAKRVELEGKVEEIEDQMKEIQDRLKTLNDFTRETTANNMTDSDFPDRLLSNLTNMLARSGTTGIMVVASAFLEEHPGSVIKRKVCAKIEEIAVKEKREDEGDTKPQWYIRDDCIQYLDAETLKFLRKHKEEKLAKKLEDNKAEAGVVEADANGAPGPDGTIVLFPEYDGREPPRESKKAFTHFCVKSRKDIKSSLSPEKRKDKNLIHRILKERWAELPDFDKEIWKAWETWDCKRFTRDNLIYESESPVQTKRPREDSESKEEFMQPSLTIPKKRKT